MTEEQYDEVHELQGRIHEAVHKLVDEMTAGVDDEVDELVRIQLTEQFRFWRSYR